MLSPGGETYGHTVTTDFFTPDINGDGDVDCDDVTLFVSLFTSSDDRADWDRSGILDSTDISEFNSAYTAASGPSCD